MGNLKALLWHHCNFYKHNKVTLVFTILLPLLVIPFAVLYFAYFESSLTKYKRCEFRPIPLFTSASLNYDQNHQYYGSAAKKIPPIITHAKCHIIPTSNFNAERLTKPHDYEQLLKPFANKTLYFTAEAETTTKRGNDFIKILAGIIRNIANSCSGGACNKLKKTYTPIRPRIKRYSSSTVLRQNWRADQLQFSELPWKMDVKDKSEPIWAGVVMNRLTGNDIEYTIISKNAADSDGFDSLFLQDLIDHAIIKYKTNQQIKHDTSIAYLPQQCQLTRSKKGFQNFQSSFVFQTFIVFLMPAINFLQQLLVEKELRLDEYQEIMGVGKVELKLSWIIFHSIVIVPLIVVITIVLHCLPTLLTAGTTDPGIILALLVLYNWAQLSFCQLMASMLTSSKRSGIFLAFLGFAIFVIGGQFIFSSTRLQGPFLIFTRVCYFHYLTPAIAMFRVITDWRRVWLPIRWKNAFLHPDTDVFYYGFAESLLVLIAQIFIYNLLSWYFGHLLGIDGMKRKPWFFLQCSFWVQDKGILKTFDENTTVTRASNNTQKSTASDDVSLTAGISLIKLEKSYGSHIALNSISTEMYESEISVLLGQNGAGKSTLINCLIGLVHPTDGTALVGRLDIRSQMAKIRHQIGFVPQHDLLYPYMTVKEHIHFYTMLRRGKSGSSKKQVDGLLDQMDLRSRLSTKTTQLSGGQKRKLSVLTAFIGDSKVIILDEPTSGVDPHSRRVIWDAILRLKQGRTILLSTHHMEEADVLAERLFILKDGNLIVAGTPRKLQDKYQTGYKLDVTLNNLESKTAIQTFVGMSELGAIILQDNGTSLSYRVPKEIFYGQQMVQFLEGAEQKKSELGIHSIGISEPKSEEIFFAATGLDQKVCPDMTSELESGVYSADQIEVEGPTQKRKAGSCCSQLATFFWKRVLQTGRSPIAMAVQILIPILLVLAMSVMLQDISETYTTSLNTKNTYGNNIFIINDIYAERNVKSYVASNGLTRHCQRQCKKNEKLTDRSRLTKKSFSPLSIPKCRCDESCDLKDAFQSHVAPNGDIIYGVGDRHQVERVASRLNQTGDEFNVVQGWLKIADSAGNKSRTLWVNPRTKEATLNVYNNILLKQEGNDDSLSIKTNIEVNPPPRPSIISVDNAGVLLGLLFCACLITAMCIVTYIQTENAHGVRNLQVMAGMNPMAYWFANLCFDMLVFLVVIGAMAVCIKFVMRVSDETIFNLIVVLVTYAWVQTCFNYMLSFAFSTVSGIFKLQIVLAIVCYWLVILFVPGAVIFQYVCLKGETCLGLILTIIEVIFTMLYPAFFLMDGIIIVFLHNTFKKTVFFNDNALSFQYLGCRVALSVMMGLIYYCVTLLLQHKNVRKDCYCSSCCYCGKRGMRTDVSKFGKDADVLMEETRVMMTENLKDPVIVKELSMKYRMDNFSAVDRLTFSVKQGECFGLLGFNGAGKSTTFEILTSGLNHSNGVAMIAGLDVRRNRKKTMKKISYCPQTNALFLNLTVKEHLNLYGALHGISGGKQSNLVNQLVQLAGLEPYLKTLAGKLSGGNKRKLQLLIALIGNREIIFLDEPTTGLDPGSKRLFWKLIKQIIKKRNCSVVLTSHSMDECEVLCDRIGIMACGGLRCIGTLQRLKDRFGQCYTFKINFVAIKNQEAKSNAEMPKTARTQTQTLTQSELGGPNTNQAGEADNPADPVPNHIQKIKNYISTKLPNATLTEQYSSLLVYKISVTDLQLSVLFKALHLAKDELNFLSFSVSQITLEEIFVGLARLQNVAEAGGSVVIAPDGTVCLLNDLSIKMAQNKGIRQTGPVPVHYPQQPVAMGPMAPYPKQQPMPYHPQPMGYYPVQQSPGAYQPNQGFQQTLPPAAYPQQATQPYIPQQPVNAAVPTEVNTAATAPATMPLSKQTPAMVSTGPMTNTTQQQSTSMQAS